MKTSLRKKVLSFRDTLTPEELAQKSGAIWERLTQITAYSNATFPMFYANFKSEVITKQTIKERLKKKLPVVLPKTVIGERRLIPYLIKNWETDIVPGAYGILEPNPNTAERIAPDSIDVVIVPGSVFDKRCGRHGYGGGYYDRFLSEEAKGAIRIGLAFSIQVMEKIPLDPHDQKMDIIVSEDETIQCNKG